MCLNYHKNNLIIHLECESFISFTYIYIYVQVLPQLKQISEDTGLNSTQITTLLIKNIAMNPEIKQLMMTKNSDLSPRFIGGLAVGSFKMLTDLVYIALTRYPV